MAEAYRVDSKNSNRISNINQDESFCLFNVLCVFLSLITILADLTTDILVFAEYCKDGYFYWALATLVFILSPNILTNIFSLRWHLIDSKVVRLSRWITHTSLVGLLERFIIFIYEVAACKNVESMEAQKLLLQKNDLGLLHFVYIFTGTIPQAILQLYAIVALEENYQTKVVSLIASSSSIAWSIAVFNYNDIVLKSQSFNCNSLILKLVWHYSMISSRILGILLFTLIFGFWTTMPLGLHWLAMTLWITTQKTSFCPNILEETLYNIVMGLVYCFCYINVQEGHTRYRLIIYYTLILTQNFGSLLLYSLISDYERQTKPWSIIASIGLIASTSIGLSAMIFYYRYFHVNGPILWRTSVEDIELNNTLSKPKSENEAVTIHLKNVRSFKCLKTPAMDENNRQNVGLQNQQQNAEVENADKKFLLDNWIARSGLPTFTSASAVNNSIDASSIELHTIENTPISDVHQNNISSKFNKKNKIYSPTEITLKLSFLENVENSIDEITSLNLNAQKRRGICSSDELKGDLANRDLETSNLNNLKFMKYIKNDHESEISRKTDGTNKKTSSDSIDMDLDLSFSDINSSDINTFNENIVQKLCLSALKNIKVGNQDADIENIQRIALDILKKMYAKKGNNKNCITIPPKQRDLDTPTEILSVHDYENICAVNIAREAWGLRSWNGYSDIENWLHDGSVVRDRRRDTLTSASSEISSCMSQELKNAILTAPPFPNKYHTYCNVFVKFDKSHQEDYNDANILNSIDDSFLVKPDTFDTSHDQNHLEPILEEIDDLCDLDTSNKKRLDSESSLVATINEIRKSTITNSPSNLYYKRKELWNSPDYKSSEKLRSDLKKVLWKEPSKLDPCNTMGSMAEKENIFSFNTQTLFEPSEKVNPIKLELGLDFSSNFSTSMNTIATENNFMPKSTLKRQISTSPTRKNVYKSDQYFQDLSNKNIDFLWHLVTENSSIVLNTNEDLSLNRLTSSLQSLIEKDLTSLSSNPNCRVSSNKTIARNKPRRKFSILRERFEPKISLNSDEEVLYRSSDPTSSGLREKPKNMKRKSHCNNASTEIVAVREYSNFTLTEERKNIPDVIVSEQNILAKSIKDKRSLFMKQVLNPPKLRYKF